MVPAACRLYKKKVINCILVTV